MSSALLVVGCARTPDPGAPLSVAPHPLSLKRLPSSFPPADPTLGSWSEERLIGRAFAKEGDFYRAITAFKRALILLPPDAAERRLEMEYDILLAYCLAQRWPDALLHYRSSQLSQASSSFPARRDLLLLVQEILLQTGDPDGAARIDQGLSAEDAATSRLNRQLTLRQWDQIEAESFRQGWSQSAKSPSKAALLQGIFPGAGYWYVGQKGAAITSFCLNALTTAAAVSLAVHDEWAAAALVGSLEVGWYVGGMNGAALAAHQWNRRLGETLAQPMLTQDRVATLFRLEYSF